MIEFLQSMINFFTLQSLLMGVMGQAMLQKHITGKWLRAVEITHVNFQCCYGALSLLHFYTK